MKTTTEFLENFTRREDALIARARAINLDLPERLQGWRQWIGDSQIYLNELKNFVETGERKANNKPAIVQISEPALVGSTIWFIHEGRKYVAQISHDDRPSVVGAQALFARMAGTISNK